MEAIGINLNFLISYIINFVIILFLLARFVWNPIMNLLDQRRQRIQDSLAEAERISKEAAQERAAFQAQLAEERQRNAAQLAEAAKQGQQVREEIISAAQRERDQILTNAQREAEGVREQAITDARRDIVDLAIQAAQRVVGASMDETRQRQLVNDFLNRELELRRTGDSR
ncbi:MAG: F0F1 ATP synthase subunit B [Anaerolineae bacterium]|nr:F0F1 ATP synthase subunit B [Anaerolineae bacterium]